MRHNYALSGYGYRLRPVKLSDAQFIVEIRTEDSQRNRYIHAISSDPADQERWLNNYFTREDDYYFVIENRLTGASEGLISFYDIQGGEAEWGRWVIRKGSLAAAESVYLLYRIAFEQAGLSKLYCRTIRDNTAVVSFHQSIGEHIECILPGVFEIDGIHYDAVKQYADREIFYHDIAPRLEFQASRIFRRNMKTTFGGLMFDHIGVATSGIEKELPNYTLLGYTKDGEIFEDRQQGIRGLFFRAEGQPRLELLENLPGSTTLDIPLAKGNKFYHIGYTTEHFDAAMQAVRASRARVISQPKISHYFGKRIAFLVLPNMQMIELIER